MSTRAAGVLLALVTAMISGVAVYVNGHARQALRRRDGLHDREERGRGRLLLVLALAPPRRRAVRTAHVRRCRARRGPMARRSSRSPCIGGSVPFVLFFEGLARATATQAAFIQKTLVVWVALLAVPLLRERLRPAASGRDRAARRRPGVDRGDAGTIVVRRGRGDDPRGDAALGGRGRARQAARSCRSTPRTLARGADGARDGAAPRLGRRLGPQGRARWRSACRAVAVGAPHRLAAHRLRRDLVRGARPRAGGRRHRGARLRRGRDRALSGAASTATPVDVSGSCSWPPAARSPALLALRPRPGAALRRDRRARSSSRATPTRRTRWASAAPTRTRTLLEYGDAGASDGGLAELARTFEGAWPYLELIAGANGIADPLDPRVVEAYWVGNGAARPCRRREPRAPRRRAVPQADRARLGHVLDAVAAGAVPHHCFHVFAVYPWLGLHANGRSSTSRCDVLDQLPHDARGGRGRSTATEATVLVRPLVWDGRVLRLGDPVVRHASWRRDGLGFLHELRPNDWVSLHWDWVCDRLEARQARVLSQYTRRMLALANRASVPAALA